MREANKLVSRVLAGGEATSEAELTRARQAARALLIRSMKMGHQQIAWRRLDAALRLGIDMDEQMRCYFTRLPRPTLEPGSSLRDSL